MTFTISDRASAQRHLNLSPAELESNSNLFVRMNRLENLDATLGSNKVAYTQRLLELLNSLELTLDTETPINPSIGIRIIEIYGEIKTQYQDSNVQGSLSGTKRQYDKYLIELKRELSYEFDTYYSDQIGCLVV